MAMGKKKGRQGDMWIATVDLTAVLGIRSTSA